MPRKTVSLPLTLERTVRLFQARLLTTLDRDVSFTEALNVALAVAFAVPDVAGRVNADRWRDLLADSGSDDVGALIDVADVVFSVMGEVGPAQKATERPGPAGRRRSSVSYETSEQPEPVEETSSDTRDASIRQGTAKQGERQDSEQKATTVGPTIALDASLWGIKAETARGVDGEAPWWDDARSIEEGARDQGAGPDGANDASAGEGLDDDDEFGVESEVSKAGERVKPARPSTVSDGDLEHLRRAVLDDEDMAKEPAAREAPERDDPRADDAPPEPSAREGQVEPRRDRGDVESSGSQRAANPDYPGIDPSQWESVEEKPKRPMPKLTNEELSKALEEAAAAYEDELRRLRGGGEGR